MNVFGDSQFTQILLWIYSHDSHLSQKPAYSFRTDQYAKFFNKINHAQHPLVRVFLKFLIHITHQLQIFRIFCYRLIIYITPIYSQKLTLSANTNLIQGIYDFFEGFSIPNCSETLLQNNRARESRSQTCLDYAERSRLRASAKSTSTSNRPIFSYKAFSRFITSSSGALVEKISEPREMNSRFQFEII